MKQCESCDNNFEDGEGHMCWCPDCEEVHPMCDNCYLKAVKAGNIESNIYELNDKEKYT